MTSEVSELVPTAAELAESLGADGSEVRGEQAAVNRVGPVRRFLARRWTIPVLGFVMALLVVLPMCPKLVDGYDGALMAEVGRSLADNGTPLIHPVGDGYALNSPYVGYGLGTSVAMAVTYKVGGWLQLDLDRSLASTNAVIFALTVAAIAVLVRRRGAKPWVVAATTAIFALGTPLLAYSITAYSESGIALFVTLAIIGLDGVHRGSRWAAVGTGVAIGATVLIRTDSLLLIAVPVALALVLLSRRLRWDLIGFAVGFTPIALVWAAYNQARFGSPITSGYTVQPFSHPFWQGLYGLTLSPGRGILVYVPLIVVAAVALRYQRGSGRAITVLGFVLIVVRCLFYARWWSWWGGDTWGSRFVFPVIPALAPAVAFAIGRWYRNVALYIPMAAGLAVSVIGVATFRGEVPFSYGQAQSHLLVGDLIGQYQGEDRARYVIAAWTDPAYDDATDAVMFDWSRFPFFNDDDVLALPRGPG